MGRRIENFNVVDISSLMHFVSTWGNLQGFTKKQIIPIRWDRPSDPPDLLS